MKTALTLSLLSPLLFALLACTAPRDPEAAADQPATAPVESAPPADAPPANAPPADAAPQALPEAEEAKATPTETPEKP